MRKYQVQNTAQDMRLQVGILRLDQEGVPHAVVPTYLDFTSQEQMVVALILGLDKLLYSVDHFLGKKFIGELQKGRLEIKLFGMPKGEGKDYRYPFSPHNRRDLA